MEFSEQTPATQETILNPTTEMTEATLCPIEEITTLNALLIETSPLAFLETMAPNNAFASLNAQAATLLVMPVLPEIPLFISRSLIKRGSPSPQDGVRNRSLAACSQPICVVF